MSDKNVTYDYSAVEKMMDDHSKKSRMHTHLFRSLGIGGILVSVGLLLVLCAYAYKIGKEPELVEVKIPVITEKVVEVEVPVITEKLVEIEVPLVTEKVVVVDPVVIEKVVEVKEPSSLPSQQDLDNSNTVTNYYIFKDTEYEHNGTLYTVQTGHLYESNTQPNYDYAFCHMSLKNSDGSWINVSLGEKESAYGKIIPTDNSSLDFSKLNFNKGDLKFFEDKCSYLPYVEVY